ncbi:Flp family type IVb pilin [Emcibacter sp.]|uniref:Flp family type IVb pilin n=1 Tax=Emcibacter sp. TaxID=1979954 RepID=UPI002AA92F54|nr:Flp family type IVb pilin [Emcibacter sp.]
MTNRFYSNLFRNEKGATAIEYGLLAAMIVIAAISGLNSFSSSFLNMSNNTTAAVQEATSNSQ